MTKPGRRIDFWGDLLEEQGLTQRQLASHAEVNRTTLRRIEAKRARGDIDVIERLLDYLGYELEAIHRDALAELQRRMAEAQNDPVQRSRLAATKLIGLQPNGRVQGR